MNRQGQNNKKPEGADSSFFDQRPHLFRPGQSGNPGGRPKGIISLKEYARQHLQKMTEKEKLKFMEGLDKDVIWKMAEGNPKNDMELTGNLNISKVLDEIENGSETQGQTVEDEPPVQD